MTFIVSPKGIKNTEGTTAKFGSGGRVQIGGDFQNTGNVEVDIRANLNVLGNIINSGNFNIKDYVEENKYKVLEKAISDLTGEPREYLQSSYDNLKAGKINKANRFFGKFISYLKAHPELITGSIQILLQLFFGMKINLPPTNLPR